MDFKLFQKIIGRVQSPRWSPRQKRLDAYRRALNGELYDHIGMAFSQERTGPDGWSGKQVLLDDRRAAVQDQLPVQATREICGLLFGESHRPTIRVKDDDKTSDWIQAFIRDTHFWLVMTKILWEASVGSTCVVLRVLGEQEEDAEGGYTPKGKGAFHFEIWPAHECKPIFHRTAPEELKSVERVWFVGADALAADGYNVEELIKHWKTTQRELRIRRSSVVSSRSLLLAKNDESDWVLRIILTKDGEQWFIPVPRWMYERDDWNDNRWIEDGRRSAQYASVGLDLQEVPARWVVPLPLNQKLAPDGCSLFGDVLINYQFRIDRTLSQVGRAFDYVGDPQMARILDQAQGGKGFGDGFDQTLAVGGTASDMLEQYGGDIKFVEISGEGLKVAAETYVKVLREAGRETAAMSRISPDNKALTQLSAVAMKLLNAAQYALADILRITVGEAAITALIRLAMRLYASVDVALPSLEVESDPDTEAVIDFSWPQYVEPHGQEKLFELQAVQTAVEASLISQETGVENAASMFDVLDTADELKRVQGDQKAKQDNDLEVADKQAQIAAKYAAPAGGTSGGGGSGRPRR